MILDTNFVIDFLRSHRGAVERMRLLVDCNEIFGITAPTIFELWTGIFALDKREKERLQINSIISNLLIYPLDDESAKLSGRINGELIKKGLKIDPEDCMIAGITIKNNQKLITNDEHFNRIEGLKVEGY